MIDFVKLKEQMEEDKETFYLLIAGTRTFDPYGSMVYPANNSDGYQIIDNYDVCEHLIDTIIKKPLERNNKIVIVHGGARGSDQIADIYAKKHKLSLKVFPADWDKYGKSAGYRRNEQMFMHITIRPHKGCIMFWDGESPGTRSNFLLAYESGVPLRVYLYMEKRFMTQDEISSLQVKMQNESLLWKGN